MRRLALFVVLVAATGCVTTGTETCADGSICRAGTTCHAVTATETTECVTPDQLTACAGMDDNTPCDGGAGTCFSEACLPAGCGNGRVENTERCDDGNNQIGDGCSLNCQDEVCGNGFVDPITLEPDNEDDGDDPQVSLNEQCDEGDRVGHDGCSSSCLVEQARWSDLIGLPPKRLTAGAAEDIDARKVVMFGGFDATDGGNDGLRIVDGTALGDTWELTTGGWSRVFTVTAPPPRGAHAMVYDPDRNRVIMFGGTAAAGRNGGAAFADTWEYKDGRWKLLPPSIVGAEQALGRYGHAMVFVPGTGIVMFGGYRKGNFAQGTWVFANDTWSPLFSNSASDDLTPSPRAFHTMTYDPVHGVVVLSGGTDANENPQPLADSWKLDVATGWTQISATDGPLAFGSSAAFDRVLQRVVVTGGSNGPQPEDITAATWAFDGTGWVAVNASGLPVRYGGVGTADPATGQLTVFGGRFDGSCGIVACVVDLDVFTMTENTVTPGTYGWTERGYVLSPSLANHGAAYDIDRRRTVVFGGATGSGQSDATYEIVENTWIEHPNLTPRPQARRGVAMAYGIAPDGTRGTLMFGGIGGSTTFQDTWRWNGTAWTQLVGSAPPPRRFAAMQYDISRGRFVLFGGEPDSGTPLADTWELTASGWTQVTPAVSPPIRSRAATVYDPLRKVIWLFGGSGKNASNADEDLGDMWSFDGTTWTKHETSNGPGPRTSTRMAYDAARKTIVLMGGGAPANAEAWEWDGETWTFISTFELPLPRMEHILVTHPLGGVLAHGGSISVLTIPGQQYLVRETLEPYATCHSLLDDDSDGDFGCDDNDCWASCSPWCPPGVTCAGDQPRCGDGQCQMPREDCAICPTDCGACP